MISALSPPTCYPDSYARFKIAGAFVIAPFFALHMVPAWMVARGLTFAFGVGMWGQPVLIWAGKQALQYLPPNWPELVDIRNSILSRVPTDAQLTIHLLRVAEALETPLPVPPPPPLKGTPKEAIKDSSPADLNEEDEAEIEEAEEQGGAKEAAVKTKHKTKGAILGLFRHGGKKAAGAGGDVSVDGKGKRVCPCLCPRPLLSCSHAMLKIRNRSETRLTSSCSRARPRMKARSTVGNSFHRRRAVIDRGENE